VTRTNFETITVQIAEGVQMVVRSFASKEITASIFLGEFPTGKPLSFTTVFGDATARVEVPASAPPCLWFGHTSVELPWLELLKVADFLRLDIPLSIPPGEQVPA
jgi:hypothetical protein